jgi:hypothetical protein
MSCVSLPTKKGDVMRKVSSLGKLATGFYRIKLPGGFSSDKFIEVHDRNVIIHHTSGYPDIIMKIDLPRTSLWRCCAAGNLYLI